MVQGRLRRKYHVLQTLSLIVKEHIEDFVILAIIVRRYHRHVLTIGVLVARLLEFFFFGREMRE